MTSPRFELIVFGGSAGALEPLMRVLGALPAEVTPPVAIVVHMTPRQPSLIPQLLAATSSRRVCEPEDKEPLEPATVYVAPPNYHMLIERTGTIALSVDDPVQFSRPSIDVLFESAALAYGPRVAGVVLSGLNSDGAHGLSLIASAGGLAIVQQPDTADFGDMPGAAARAASSAVSLAAEDIGPFLGDQYLSRLEYAP